MTRLKPGDKAPAFSVNDIWGKEVNLPHDQKWVYLSFHRFSACPLCNLRTNELINAYGQFKENNMEIYSIWPSREETMKVYVGKSDAPFPLIADPEMQIFQLYSVTHRSNIPWKGVSRDPQIWMHALKHVYKNFETDGDAKLHPAGFLINPGGIVEIAYYGQHFGDHINIQHLIGHVKA